MRILIVEDDTALASFIRKGLEAEHYAVDAAAEGEQGRSMALEFDYDLLILDLNLPGIDGPAILKSLRQRKPSLRVMILTARSRVEDRVQCLDMGADDYLVKPFSLFWSSRRAHEPCCAAATRLPSPFWRSAIFVSIVWSAASNGPAAALI